VSPNVERCRGKRGHETEAAAEEHAKVVAKTLAPYITVRLGVQKCRTCRKWHVVVLGPQAEKSEESDGLAGRCC